jgi:hypothetical protein
MKHPHRVTERKGARRIAADTQCLLGSEGKLWRMKQPTFSIWRNMMTMDGAPMSTLGLAVAGFTIDLGDGAPHAKALQARIPRIVGASAAKE